jgi:hypothetical protein
MSGFIGEHTGHCRHAGRTYRRQTGNSARSRSLPWRTRSSSGRKNSVSVVGPPLERPDDEKEYQRVFAALAQADSDSLYVADEPENVTYRRLIVDMASKGRLPTIYPWRQCVEAGGLMSYGIDLSDLGHRIVSKENALPYDLWGLITRDWRPTPEEGVTVFLQGLEKRGPNNLRKRIYFSGVTPDLYKPMYSPKVVAFLDKLMDQRFAGRPFMRHYLDYYFDLCWDLHLGVTGDDIPFEVRQIGGVLQYRSCLQKSAASDHLPELHDCSETPRLSQIVDR